MYGIEIENGQKIKCPNCNSIYAIRNEDEVLYRNITLLYVNESTQTAEAKCKRCKAMIEIDLSKNQKVAV